MFDGTTGVDRWPERHQALLELCDLVERRRRLLTSQIEMPRSIAAACLIRCRRLLLAMDAEVAAGFNDALGAQLRAIFELYVVGSWIVLAPDEAYEDRARDYRRNVGVMDRDAAMALPDVEGSALMLQQT